MKAGGYEKGYASCDYFWGKKPADFVVKAAELLSGSTSLFAIDFGCGDGKNSNYLSSNGFDVTAVDISLVAIENAKKLWDVENVNWIVSDLRTYEPTKKDNDLVLATGSPHCLSSEDEVSALIDKMKDSLRSGGFIVLYSFNDEDHDFNGHESDFNPILLPHSWYVKKLHGFKVILESNVTQGDIHPDTNIEHHHSITRILAKKM